MEVFTMYVAREFADRKIRCNIVAPGALDTDFGGGRTDEARRQLAEATAMGRIGQAEDIGILIASLLSEDFRWVDGQRIEATGGAHL
jgi:NAD(P)-dependent dehydrogenase (short-subunit alcohol dehydrogenase family)